MVPLGKIHSRFLSDVIRQNAVPSPKRQKRNDAHLRDPRGLKGPVFAHPLQTLGALFMRTGVVLVHQGVRGRPFDHPYDRTSSRPVESRRVVPPPGGSGR